MRLGVRERIAPTTKGQWPVIVQDQFVAVGVQLRVGWVLVEIQIDSASSRTVPRNAVVYGTAVRDADEGIP